MADSPSGNGTLVAPPGALDWQVAAGLALAGVAIGVAVPVALPFVVAALGGVAVALRPDLGLGVLVFLVYSRLSDALIRSVGAPSIAQLFIAFLLMVVLVRQALVGDEWGDWRTPSLFLFSFAAMGLGSMLYAADTVAVQDALIDLAKDGVVMVLVSILITTPVRLRIAVWGLLAAGSMLGVVGILQQITGTFDNTYWGLAQAEVQHIVGDLSDNRSGGPGIGPNGYAQILLFLVPLAIERMRNDRRQVARLAGAVAAAICSVAIVLTFSRQAFIAAIVIALAYAIYAKVRTHRVVLAGLALVALVAVAAPDGYVQRITTLADIAPQVGDEVTSEVSFRGRLSENIVAVQMFADSPVIGVGMANYNHHYLEYSAPLGLDSRRLDRSPHNLYLEFASELGVVGLTWFALLNMVAFTGLRWTRRYAARAASSVASIALALEISLIGYLVTSLFRHMAFPRYFWLIYGIVLAVPVVAHRLATDAIDDSVTVAA